MTETLKQYQGIIDGIYQKIEAREALTLEDKFAYYEAVHYLDVQGFHNAIEYSEKRAYAERVKKSLKQLNNVEARFLGPQYRVFGVLGDVEDHNNGFH